MTPSYSIALAQERHLGALSAIELAAAQLLRGHAPEPVLRETIDSAILLEAARYGRLWVALSDAAPVGFAQIEMLAADMPHLNEIDVEPSHGRRGLGTALVRAVCAWATDVGYPQLTLVTFRAVPWNMPFYARMGFVEVSCEDWRPELAAVVARETARGLVPENRVVMAYDCQSSTRIVD
jgi:GNAT superfamily N-acetyltransferase